MSLFLIIPLLILPFKNTPPLPLYVTLLSSITKLVHVPMTTRPLYVEFENVHPFIEKLLVLMIYNA